MRIDEFEFRNKQGEEIEPTKEQLVVYIKSLHKNIKELEKALELACEKYWYDCGMEDCPDNESDSIPFCENYERCKTCPNSGDMEYTTKYCWADYFKYKAKRSLSND